MEGKYAGVLFTISFSKFLFIVYIHVKHHVKEKKALGLDQTTIALRLLLLHLTLTIDDSCVCVRGERKKRGGTFRF